MKKPKKNAGASPKGKAKRKAALPFAAFADVLEDHVVAGPTGSPPAKAIFRVQGRMSTFGGPDDHGVGPAEGLALFEPPDMQDPRFRDLFLPYQPPGTTGLARRLNPAKAYLACWWNYDVTSRSFLRNAIAKVQSVRTARIVEARPADKRGNRHDYRG